MENRFIVVASRKLAITLYTTKTTGARVDRLNFAAIGATAGPGFPKIIGEGSKRICCDAALLAPFGMPVTTASELNSYGAEVLKTTYKFYR